MLFAQILSENMWIAIATALAAYGGVNAMRLRGRVEDAAEEKKYELGDFAQEVGNSGFVRFSEFIRRALAGQTAKAMHVGVEIAKLMKTKEGRMEMFGPIVVKNKEDLVAHPEYGPPLIEAALAQDKKNKTPN